MVLAHPFRMCPAVCLVSHKNHLKLRRTQPAKADNQKGQQKLIAFFRRPFQLFATPLSSDLNLALTDYIHPHTI